MSCIKHPVSIYCVLCASRTRLILRKHSWCSSTHTHNTPNANMADHSVGARNELHESEASEASVFCFDKSSPENLASWTVWSVLFRYA